MGSPSGKMLERVRALRKRWVGRGRRVRGMMVRDCARSV